MSSKHSCWPDLDSHQIEIITGAGARYFFMLNILQTIKAFVMIGDLNFYRDLAS